MIFAVMPEEGWTFFVQFGVVGVMAFAFGWVLYNMVQRQNKEREESNSKVVTLLETTVREATKVIAENTAVQRDNAYAKLKLSEAISTLPCHEWKRENGKSTGAHGKSILDT